MLGWIHTIFHYTQFQCSPLPYGRKQKTIILHKRIINEYKINPIGICELLKEQNVIKMSGLSYYYIYLKSIAIVQMNVYKPCNYLRMCSMKRPHVEAVGITDIND